MSRPRPLRPENEQQRLEALRSYHILDTPAESDYDTVAELAAIACDAPLAAIALVDEERVWPKAAYGFETCGAAREDAFCSHTILSREILEVPDTLEDFRFAENPAVVGEPFVRFYAGVPLIDSDGFALGALCVIDRRPRVLSATERSALTKFAAHVVALLAMRRRQRVRAEQELKLRRREERLRDLIEGCSDIIFETDAAGHFAYVNQAAHTILGFDTEDLLGKHFSELVHPEHREFVWAHYRAQAKHRIPSTYLEFPSLTVDGTEVWFGQHARAVIRDDKVVAFHAVSRDITALRMAERAKRDVERRFQAFMDNSPALAFIKDADDRYVFVNETMLRTFGRSREEVVGTPSSALLPADLQSMVASSEEIVRVHGQQLRVVETMPSANGEERHWLMHKFPVPGPDDSVFIGAVGVDVTDRITLELELADARDAAIASAKQKTEFLAMMSHEIRTPMNGVLGMLGVLLDSELTADQRDVVETAKYSADSLLGLLNDILDLSKIEAGRLDIESFDFELRPTIDSVLDLVADNARTKSLDVRCEVDPNIPLRVRGDAGRVRQVLLNLTANAVKFTSKGSVVVRVGCESKSESGVTLRFSVADTGIGIPLDAQNRLFAPFVQADSSTTRRFGGTGLGLAISRRLVEMMHGQIGVESTIGQGSTFWFTTRFEIPQEIVVPMPTIETTAAARTLAAAPRTRRARILVAEDNAVNQKVALRLLAKLGYRADVVANGLETIDALHSAPYDLVLMDCHMPEMDGYAATRMIRARERDGVHIPIVALTASAMEDDRKRCFAAGMDDVLTKPIREEELGTALEKWLPDEEPALDTASLLEITDGDDEFLQDLIETYITESQKLLFSIMKAPSTEDFARAVHALSGSSRNVGAVRLGRICMTAEERARTGADAEELAALVPVIRNAHAATCEALAAM